MKPNSLKHIIIAVTLSELFLCMAALKIAWAAFPQASWIFVVVFFMAFHASSTTSSESNL